MQKPTSFLNPRVCQLVYMATKIAQPFIRENSLDRRIYQMNIARSARDRSSLVVIPTGMGKTIIAVLIMAHKLELFKDEPGKKLLFMAPTKPLVDQHRRFVNQFMTVSEEQVELFTGKIPPKEREKLWKEKDIIIATPQVIQNDLLARRIDLKDVVLMVVDEAHRAVGDYAYVYIAQKYRKQAEHPQTLGITASPGGNEEHIIEVCRNLGTAHIEIRSEYDPDVLPYVHEIEMKWHMVDLPPGLQQTKDILEEIQKKYLLRLKKFGLVDRVTRVSKRELLAIQQMIQARIRASKRPPHSLFTAASTQSAAVKVNHAIELLETQGVVSLKEYAARLEKEATSKSGTKGARLLWGEDQLQYILRMLAEVEETHPKIPELVKIIRRQIRVKRDSKVLVFAHYRGTAAYLARKLNSYDGLRASRFVGQASRGKDKGFSQKKQVETIQQFKDREFNVLIATSVAEEGLDIPSTDLVVFYEPIPSEIRTIQRRGRTGRQEAGKVEVLITRKTRDEAYYWSAKNKEGQMKDQLNLFRDKLVSRIKEEMELAALEENLTAASREENETPEPGSKPEMEPDTNTARETKKSIQKPRAPRKQEQPAKVPEASETSEAPKAPAPLPKPLVRTTENTQATKKEVPPEHQSQASLFDFDGMLEKDMKKELSLSQITLVVDNREFRSPVVRHLSDMGVKLEAKQLEIGDYVVSSRVALERKEVKDFLSSLKDGRLFTQLIQLRSAYPAPILIIEGKENIFTCQGFRAESIMGSFASLLVDVGVPIIRTEDQKETADLILALIKREYAPNKKIPLRQASPGRGLRDRQRYAVEGLPGVSAVLAERLLAHFGTVRKIFTAEEQKLLKVKGVGKKTAKELKEVLDAEFE